MAPVYPNLLGMCATICSKACLTEGVVAEGVVIEGATDGRGDPSTAWSTQGVVCPKRDRLDAFSGACSRTSV